MCNLLLSGYSGDVTDDIVEVAECFQAQICCQDRVGGRINVPAAQFSQDFWFVFDAQQGISNRLFEALREVSADRNRGVRDQSS